MIIEEGGVWTYGVENRKNWLEKAEIILMVLRHSERLFRNKVLLDYHVLVFHGRETAFLL